MTPSALAEFRALPNRIALTLACALASASPISAQSPVDSATSHGLVPQFSSGTSWEPAASRAHDLRPRPDGWTLMLHGQGMLAYVDEPDPRGDCDAYVTSMLGVRASRPVGPGRFEARLMVTAEPLMGPRGYPLLLQTGETADGFRPLFDRQHPHDLVMELGVLYRWQLGPSVSPFVYLAPVGEPALGPTAFMHRGSGREFPSAPIVHHFQDATHVTYGVVTLGVTIGGRAKLETSIFHGREPDQHRWNIEGPRFDSYSFRVTLNPGPNWTLQASVADIDEPEQIHPGLDARRATVSLGYHRPTSSGYWSTTAAFGVNRWGERTTTVAGIDFVVPARTQLALLLESTLHVHRWTAFTRFETAEKDELFDPLHPNHNTIYHVTKVDVGSVFDVVAWSVGSVGIGVAGSIHFLPAELDSVYGVRVPLAFRIFTRLHLADRFSL